jgi:cyclopropane fatty-acyl-phospholipid synthase-like methyltransferase
MGPRACIACGRTGPFPPLFARDGFSLVRCDCGLVFQDPQPSEELLADAYYSDAEFARALMAELREITLGNARHKVQLLEASSMLPAPGSTLLDVGASSGAWLEVAAESAGLVGIGVELGEATAAGARGRGLDIRTGTLDDALAGLGDQRFDLITFWDVLEHLTDPRHELALAASRLAPGGAIAATFPNCEGLYPRLTHRLFAKRTGIWEYPELPVHLYDFSPTTARAIFAGAGFDVVDVRTFPTPYGFYRTTSLAPERIGGGWRGRLLRAAFDLTHRAAYPLARVLDRGNSMFIVARRR